MKKPKLPDINSIEVIYTTTVFDSPKKTKYTPYQLNTLAGITKRKKVYDDFNAVIVKYFHILDDNSVENLAKHLKTTKGRVHKAINDDLKVKNQILNHKVNNQ